MKKTIIIALTLILVLASFTSCENNTHEHTWDNGTVTKAATCTEKGVTTYTCTVCKETKTEDIAIDSENHTWDKGKATTAATCTEAGEKVFTCTGCKKTKTVVIEALGHNLKEIITEAGFLTNGSIIDKCSRCNYSIIKEESEAKDISGTWLMSERLYDNTSCVIVFDKDNQGYLYPSTAYPIQIGENKMYFILRTPLTFSYKIEKDVSGELMLLLDINNGTNYVPTKVTETVKNGRSSIVIYNIKIQDITFEQIAMDEVSSHKLPSTEANPSYIPDPYFPSRSHMKYYICADEHTDGTVGFAFFDNEGHSPNENNKCIKCGYIVNPQ